jgi:hypothetical protein
MTQPVLSLNWATEYERTSDRALMVLASQHCDPGRQGVFGIGDGRGPIPVAVEAAYC